MHVCFLVSLLRVGVVQATGLHICLSVSENTARLLVCVDSLVRVHMFEFVHFLAS